MGKVICPDCGQRTATERELSEYRYDGCELTNIILHGGAFETACSECGANYYHVVKLGQLLQVLALTLLTSPHQLLGPELRFLRRSCELRQGQLAGILRCRRATVAEREAAGQSRSSDAEQMWVRLVLLREFRNYLEKWPERNFLSPTHMEQLDVFEREFARRALEVSRRAFRLHKQELTLRPDGSWEAARAA